MPKLIDRIPAAPLAAISAAALVVSFGLCGVSMGSRQKSGQMLGEIGLVSFGCSLLALLSSLLLGAIQAIRSNPTPHARRYFLIAFAATVSCNLLSIGFCSVVPEGLSYGPSGSAGASLFFWSAFGAFVSGLGAMLFPREGE